jgi:hypothetical protein
MSTKKNSKTGEAEALDAGLLHDDAIDAGGDTGLNANATTDVDAADQAELDAAASFAATVDSDQQAARGAVEEAAVAPPAARGEQPAKPKKPVGPRRQAVLNYVNCMLNMGRVAGFSVSSDGNGFMLQQNNNIEHALRIRVESGRLNVAATVGRPMTVTVHVRGYRDEHGPQMAIHYLKDERPSILDLPMERVWAAGFGGIGAASALRKLASEGFTPFDADGKIKPEFAAYIASGDELGYELTKEARDFVNASRVMSEIAEISGGSAGVRGSAGLNFIKVAGFVDAFVRVPPTKHRKEYGMILLRQHADRDACIPVRLTGAQAMKTLASLKIGMPIMVMGNMRRKVIPDDNNNIVSAHTYIETTRISAAQFGVDIILPLPAWLAELPKREAAERERRQAEHQRRVEAAAKRRAEMANEDGDDGDAGEGVEAL